MEVDKILDEMEKYVMIEWEIQGGNSVYYLFKNGFGALVSKGVFKDGVEVDIYLDNNFTEENYKYKTIKTVSEILAETKNRERWTKKEHNTTLSEVSLYILSKEQDKQRDKRKLKKSWHFINR